MQVIPFGKHANKPLSDVPSDYLNWMIKTINDKPDLISVIKKELENRNTPKLKYDPLIFGKDQTEDIVNITVNETGAHVFFRNGTSKVVPYKPWALGPYEASNSKRLEGDQYYKFIKEYDYDLYVNDFLDNKPREIFTPRSIEEGFMMRNGFTYYKNMKIEDVSLLSFDIETTTSDATLEGSEVVLISNTFRKNGALTRKLFDVQDYEFNQIKMIEAWETWVREANPDILLGHNIFSFDLPYLNTIKPLKLGRDGSEIFVDHKKSKFRKDGSQQYEYHNMKILGREICDTYFLSIKYDISRHFPSYGLKAIEKYLKLVDENRIEWDFTKHPVKSFYKTNSSLWQEFKEYCRQDGDSPIQMFDIMAPSLFYLNQSVPKTFQQMINEATGSQLDSIMIRSYLQDNNSIPKSSNKKEFEGAISMGVAGVYKNVRKIDVTSEYPSVMLQYEIYDKQKDPNKHLLKILKYFRDERINNKSNFKKTNDRYYDDLQNAQKTVINSIFGYLGAGYLLFNFPEGAALVTKYGREIIEKSILWATGYTVKKEIKNVRNKGKPNEEIEEHWVLDKKIQEGKGYNLVNVDTDSISYTNGLPITSEEFKKEIDEVNSLFPDLIKFEDDGIYESVVVTKAKNYIMKKGDSIKIKGSAFKSSTKEPALKEMIETILNEMLGNNDLSVIKSIYKKYLEEAKNISDIKRWSTKKTYTEKVEDSERLNETKVKDAIKEAIDKGVLNGIQQGDKIYLYQTIDGVKQKTVKGVPQFYKKTGEPMMMDNKILRLIELYNYDADAAHYMKRVEDTLYILETVLPVEEIIKSV